MAAVSLESCRILLFVCIALGVLSTAAQILSLLSWNDVDPEFMEIIHSTGIHIAYIVICLLTLVFNSVILVALKDIDSIYRMDEAPSDMNF